MLPDAFCLLPFAICLLPAAYAATACCLLPTHHCTAQQPHDVCAPPLHSPLLLRASGGSTRRCVLFSLQAALAGCMSGSTQMPATPGCFWMHRLTSQPLTAWTFPFFPISNAHCTLFHPIRPCAGIEAVARVMETWQKHEGVQCNCCLALMALVRGTGSVCQVTLTHAHSPACCTIPDSQMGGLRGRGLAREI